MGDAPEYVFTVSYEIDGQHGRYPPGLLIGQVSAVHEGSNALETDVSVKPAVDFSALEFVLVLRTNAIGGCARDPTRPVDRRDRDHRGAAAVDDVRAAATARRAARAVVSS